MLRSVVLALVHPIPLRLAVRNVRWGHWRTTVLVVLGLLVGTTIGFGSLTGGAPSPR
jgi:hypothetical protein